MNYGNMKNLVEWVRREIRELWASTLNKGEELPSLKIFACVGLGLVHGPTFCVG